jgi:enoyl-CoA hydratase/carnithine racemase
MPYADYRRLKIDVDDHLAIVTLNRPEARNAIDHVFYEELSSIFADLTHDDAVWAILVAAAGETFCVGGDVKAMQHRPAGDVVTGDKKILDPSHARRLVYSILDCDKPSVCAIHGHAIGLGALIPLLCDITVIAEDAKIGDTHVKIGLVAGDGAAAIWPILVGPARAKEFLLLSTLLTGADAARIGLVNHVVPKGAVYDKAFEMARRLADGPTWAMRWTKLSVNKILKQQVNLVLDASSALEMATFLTDDHKEAVSAFIEKRSPVFSGQ